MDIPESQSEKGLFKLLSEVAYLAMSPTTNEMFGVFLRLWRFVGAFPPCFGKPKLGMGSGLQVFLHNLSILTLNAHVLTVFVALN